MQSNICCVCKYPLFGKYFVDWDGNVVCPQHKDALCHSCRRFYGSNATEVEPGIFLCNSCMSHLITPSRAEHIIGRIRYFYRQNGIEIKSRIKLKVISAKEMAQQYSPQHQGFVVSPPVNGEFLVVILRHLSQTVFATVMAHEILHVWQFENQITPPLEICEGFCNLGSYLFLKYINSPVAQGQQILLEFDDSDIYGKGFKKLKKIYDSTGISGIISEIKKYQCTR